MPPQQAPIQLQGGARFRAGVPVPPANLPLISVVTVVRNAVKTLPRTMQSVFSQSYSHIEYIVIDGGSTDGTLDLIHAQDERLSYWSSAPDAGISDAFNKGLQQAHGTLVGWLNADDWYEPKAVEKVVQAFLSQPVDVLCGALQYWNGAEKGYVFFSRPEKLEWTMTVNHPTVFVRRELANQTLFQLRYQCAMDYDVLLRYKHAGAKFVALPDVLANMSLEGVSDRRWRHGRYEAYQIKSAVLGGRWRHWLYYLHSLARGYTGRALQVCGLQPVANYYRRHFSIVKKI